MTLFLQRESPVSQAEGDKIVLLASTDNDIGVTRRLVEIWLG